MTKDKDDYKTAGEVAYQAIRERILSGEFKPGTKLSQRKMAALSGVSIIPVIEALVRLEHDGLVEHKPQWGARVTLLTPDRIQDLYYLREAIECQAARILSHKIDAEQRKELYEIAAELDSLGMTEEEDERFWELDSIFHRRIAEMTGIQSFVEALKRINLFNLLSMAGHDRKPDRIKRDRWHQLVVDAISSKDPAQAEKQMRTHVLDGRQSRLLIK